MRLQRKKISNLALQGGGSHGAFTWGVLDRLLEHPRIDFEGISGTSAGAMNAVVLAHGLTTGGREGARQALSDFWESIGRRAAFSPLQADLLAQIGCTQNLGLSPASKAFLELTQVLSPYELNPLDLNPLREIITELVDFERLRAECKIKLFVAATQVRTGMLRLFETKELTEDALLASACLPSLHHAIEIDGEAYWDGGYSANPALFPLIHGCKSLDIIMVLLQPLSRSTHPVTADEIRARVAELSFSTTFVREMAEIAQAKQQGARTLRGRLERRLQRTNFHVIEAGNFLSQLSWDTKLNAHPSFLTMLRDEGRRHADAWLRRHFRSIEARPSMNVAEIFR